MTTPSDRVAVEPCADPGDPGWLALRAALWPDTSEAEHRAEMAAQFAAGPGRFAQFVARDAHGRAVGLAEAALRVDHVNGCDSAPVAFLEGLYVAHVARRSGVARSLVAAVARWGRARGCTELASDTPLDNAASQAVHRALGFAETERVVYFKAPL